MEASQSCGDWAGTAAENAALRARVAALEAERDQAVALFEQRMDRSALGHVWRQMRDGLHAAIAQNDALRRERAEETRRLRMALERSLRMQNHYAELLNAHDGGARLGFDTVEAWMERLDSVDGKRPTPAAPQEPERADLGNTLTEAEQEAMYREYRAEQELEGERPLCPKCGQYAWYGPACFLCGTAKPDRPAEGQAHE
jgi:hypothetical protein